MSVRRSILKDATTAGLRPISPAPKSAFVYGKGAGGSVIRNRLRVIIIIDPIRVATFFIPLCS